MNYGPLLEIFAAQRFRAAYPFHYWCGHYRGRHIAPGPYTQRCPGCVESDARHARRMLRAGLRGLALGLLIVMFVCCCIER